MFPLYFLCIDFGMHFQYIGFWTDHGAEQLPKIRSKSVKNMILLKPGVILVILARFVINLVSFWCALDDLGLPFWCRFMAFAPGLALVWFGIIPQPFSLTLYGLNLDTNLYKFFVKTT